MKRSVIVWGLQDEPTSVQNTFAPLGVGAIFVIINNPSYEFIGDSIVVPAMTSVAGCGLFFSGLETYLE